jgi:transcriptional regulator of met regulon
MLPVAERKEEHKCLKQLTTGKQRRQEQNLAITRNYTGMTDIYDEHYESAKTQDDDDTKKSR